MDSCDSCSMAQDGLLVTQKTESELSFIQDYPWTEPITLIDAKKLWIEKSAFYRIADFVHEIEESDQVSLTYASFTANGRLMVGNPVTVSQLRSHEADGWITELIQEKRIKMMYQPIVDVKTKPSIIGYEMLARGVRQDGSLLPPVELFQAAKDQHKIFLLDKTCRMAGVEASAQIDPHAMIFINFIPTAIYDPVHCLRSTMEVARANDVDPSRIVFEVVETEKVQDIDHLKKILHFYREQGFRYALDDVGEGYNTIETIADLEPDIVKLDRAFVSGICEDKNKQAVAIEVADLARQKGSTILAEGIETSEEAACLKELGYFWQQGYYWGRPSFEPKRS